jgi:hypothetical protein
VPQPGWWHNAVATDGVRKGELDLQGNVKSRLVLLRATLVVLAAAFAVAWAGLTPARAAAANVPSGERIHGQSTLEPVYDDTTGNVIFIMTPNHAPLNANPASWAPIYIVVYPGTASASVGTLQCTHVPADNCPDHGPAVAGGAAAIDPGVYGPADGSGVLGHDHLLAPPGSGGDFNIAWEPVLVLFTSAEAANTHLNTLAQINTAVTNHQAFEVPLPQLTFHCEVVPANIYANATAVTPA